MYSRREFDGMRAAAKERERKDKLLLVACSVGLGLGQLAFIRWADEQLPRAAAVGIEGTVFLLYMALVVWLVWRMERDKRAGAPRCPQCAQPLLRWSERIAVATGRCDACGGQVLS
jgi:hypothetical protein